MRFFILFLFLALFATTAFAQTTQVTFSFDHKAGAAPLTLNQTIFPIWNNKMIMLTRAEFYISEVEIQQLDGMKIPLVDQYLLVNAKSPNTNFNLEEWPIEAANSVVLHLGVPASVNHNDPTEWPPHHPLAPKNPSMHWGWTAGYKFMAIEGKVDNDEDGIPETAFEIHNIFDALYKSVALTGVMEANNGVLHLHFVLDYAKLFNTIAMSDNLLQHGNAAINIAMMNNAALENFIAFSDASATQEVTANSMKIKATPNPSNSETSLEYTLPASETLTLLLVNTLGQTVVSLSGLQASGVVTLETATLSEGIYQYAFYENGNLLARKKLMVKH